MENLGEILKVKMKERRVSAEDLAIKLKISKTGNIYKWRNGSKPSDPEEYRRVIAWINNPDFIPGIPERKDEEGQTLPVSDKYYRLLEDNDRFFKNQYADLLINLTALLSQAKTNEALIKLNLQHTGTVEAFQAGVDPSEIQEQINNEISNAVSAEKDISGHS